MSAPHDDQSGWADKPKNVSRIIWGLVITCILLLIIGESPLVHKHAHFDIEIAVPFFYAIFGFIAYCCIISGAILMRKLVMRPEDYYDDDR